MIASLPMYARPELAGAHARFWALIRDGLAEAPEQLSQEAPIHTVWAASDLVLSQTCGMPYRLGLHRNVALVGAFDYGLEGCAPGYYRSAFVVRKGDELNSVMDCKEKRFAFNERHSQSGYAAAYTHLAPQGWWFADRLETGAHLASAQAVAEGRADIAAIDAMTWRLIQRYDRFVEALTVLDWTVPTPGLPLITAPSRPVEPIRAAVQMAIEGLTPEDRAALGIRGLVQIDKADYLAVPTPPETEAA